MKHQFTVIIEPNVDAEDRETVKECLQYWLQLNCGQTKNLLGYYADWKSAEVE